MLTIILTDDDRDRRGNFILGMVVAAIVKAEFPDDRRRQMDELRRQEHDLVKEIRDASPKARRKLARELKCSLPQTNEEISRVANEEGRRSWTYRPPNQFTEERKAWSAIHAEVALGKMNPRDDDGGSLPRDNYGHGSVIESELTEWMQRAGYDLQLPKQAGSNAPIVGAGETAKRKGGRKPGTQGELLGEILEDLAKWAATKSESFDPKNMPGQVGASASDPGSFHWLCAKLYPASFQKGKKAFAGYRASRCAFRPYAKKSDFYCRAITDIAQTIGVSIQAASVKKDCQKAR